MKPKKYKKPEQKSPVVEEPSVAYGASTLNDSTLTVAPDCETPADTMTTASRVSPNAHAYEEMKAALRERIDKIEVGEATFHTNEEVFSSIRDRYGL
jgi:hypothetical protein